MAKRKPTDMAQMNLRIRETLRKKVEVEARKNGHSLNSELVQRLERSFIDQWVHQMIEATLSRVENSMLKQELGLIELLIGEFNKINRATGRDELVINLKKGEHGNG